MITYFNEIATHFFLHIRAQSGAWEQDLVCIWIAQHLKKIVIRFLGVYFIMKNPFLNSHPAKVP